MNVINGVITINKLNVSHRVKINVSPAARPECSAGSVVQQLAGTPGGEVRARCAVTAPSTREAGPLRFYWTYNGTRDVLPVSILTDSVFVITFYIYFIRWLSLSGEMTTI